MTTEQHLAQLHDGLRVKAKGHLNLCKQAGYDLRITQSWRSDAVQDALYAQGRFPLAVVNARRASCLLGVIDEKTNQRTVTHAKAGESFHNFVPAFAYDVCLAGSDPYNEWETHGPFKETWETIGVLGESVGLEWGGRWDGKKTDRPHFQWAGGLTLADLRAGKRPPVLPQEETAHA